MHYPILAPRNNKLRIGSEGALNNRRFIYEVSQLVKLIPLKGIKQHNAVVSCCKHQDLAIVAELHTFYFIIVLPPVSKRTSFTVTYAIKTNANYLFIFLLN